MTLLKAQVITIAEDKAGVTVKVPITSAQIGALNTTPIVIRATAGAGVVLVPTMAFGAMKNVTTPYDTNTTLRIKSVSATDAMLYDGGLLANTSDAIGMFTLNPFVFGQTQIIANDDLVLTVAGGDPLTGDGDLDLYVTYRIITL